MNPRASSESGLHPSYRIAARPSSIQARSAATGFVVTIENARGPFEFVKGGAQYDVSNEGECGHMNEWAGVAERITSQKDVALTKVSDTEYRGVVYPTKC
jgi:hypothetical protein